MDPNKKTAAARALSLLSGGLDSQLAVCLLREQGVEVEGVVFESPFFDTSAAWRAAESLNLRVHAVAFAPDIVALLRDPPHGFGAGLNPCLDCHARMIQRAGILLEALGFDFVATGEVLNQRPMSQTRVNLARVARLSGYAERLVRPLSGRLLAPTEPERRGLISREAMLDLEGRGRKRQFSLAERFGLKDYPSPAGGCRLTEPNYCRRLGDLMEREGLGDLRRIERLRIGRHLRLPEGSKVIVGRHREDNAALEAAATPEDILLWTAEIPGPSALLDGTATQATLDLAAGITASYANAAGGEAVRIALRHGAREDQRRVAPLPRETFSRWLI